MKAPTFLCLCCAVLPWGSLRAEQSAQVMVRGIEFPPGEAEKILRTVKMEERYDAMAKAVDEGKAADVETAMLQCPMVRECTMAAIREVIYPTEYNPPEACYSFGSSNPEVYKKPPYIPGNILGIEKATAFETRHAGNDFKIEVGRDEDKPGYCDLSLEYESTTQEADRVFVRFEFYKGSPGRMAMPTFRVNRHKVHMILADGEWTMMRMFDSSRKDAPKGSKVAMWVKVETLEPKKP